MKTYCLVFKPLSTISRFPDAQTIFGAVCNIILNTQGQDSFNNYVKSFDNSPWFVHSSMMPMGLFPMVAENLFSIEYINSTLLKKESEEQISYLTEMKKYKKIQWMSEAVFIKYIMNDAIEDLRQDLLARKGVEIESNILKLTNESVSINISRQINTHVRKNGLIKFEKDDVDTELYYDSAYYCDKNMKCCIYVKTDMTKEEMFNIFKYSHYFGFGDRHSVGKNSFELIDILEKNIQCVGAKHMLLSKSSLDEKYNYSKSFYSINSKLYKTSKFYLNNKLIGRMNLLNEGSLMTVVEDKNIYGSLIRNSFDENSVYYYAIGFTF